MAYEIVMPQLSDSMDEGKLISWKIKPGDHVKKGDVIADVESDKAIMEVQSFKEGIVKSLSVKEGESVRVGSIIAVIDTDAKEPTAYVEKELPKEEKKTDEKETKPQTSQTSFLDEILGFDIVEGDASPKAKALAAQYKIDLQKLQKEGKLPIPAHQKDILDYRMEHYFTPKALQLLKQYKLDLSLFAEDKKHDSAEIISYIQSYDIPLPKEISPFQKALIKTVENSAKKPTYHLYDNIDATLILSHKKYSVSVWLIKLFAQAMMEHETFRSTLKQEHIITYPNASIALAIAHEDLLYMVVFKDANLLSVDEIDEKLKNYENKVKNKDITPKDMQGSTFAVSNLGMFGVERFDAMINADDSAIAAIGSGKENKISVTLTLDHRIINGYQAAKFMQTLKTLAKDQTLFKE